ncbi:hypothetical protein Hypma_009801 [Hypsizygus marmoreus]|uniref:Uncharacterized protein n=1 Tax=Hypsizygus marmoreus TaxID=39966 RepID=A0A369JL30_HYPMA|nr:hypothetical protein Hypma_009801 [Hypsizygus marmoreus]
MYLADIRCSRWPHWLDRNWKIDSIEALEGQNVPIVDADILARQVLELGAPGKNLRSPWRVLCSEWSSSIELEARSTAPDRRWFMNMDGKGRHHALISSSSV